MIKESLNMLGLYCKDKITGNEGTVTSIAFDLYGCVTAILNPEVQDGKPREQNWYDIQRLEIIAEVKRKMDVPDFESKTLLSFDSGPAEKPLRCENTPPLPSRN